MRCALSIQERSQVHTQLLLISCADEAGLVYKITGVLYRHAANIISNHEFVDRDAGQFFMRTAFTGADDQAAVLAELRATLPATAAIRLAPQEKRRIVVLATKESHCLGELLLRHIAADLPATIEAVISNYDALQPLVAPWAIPFHHIGSEHMERRDHEAAVEAIIEQYSPDYIVLAKYMRVLTPLFVQRYQQRIINIHHSFLPAFIGANPYRQAFQRGVKIIGATAHFVTDELDMGPIIAQDVLPVTHASTARDMAQAGRDIEKIVLAKALKLVCEERVFLSGNRTIIFE
jgi:formyltetrahydrofolate deformylase